MASITLFLESFLIGLAIAAPVGPIGILCIQQTLTHGMRVGFISGLGAATADALYGCIAAFGLITLSSFLLDIRDLLSISGGLFLLYIGFRTLSTPPKADSATPLNPHQNLWTSYITTLALTLANPMTILAFIGIFSSIRFNTTTQAHGWMILGIFLGSAAWWLGLSAGVGLFRTRITPRRIVWINRLSGGMICLFAVQILLKLWLSA